MPDPARTSRTLRVLSFDELDRYLGGAGGVEALDRRYLESADEATVAEIKRRAKEALKEHLQRRERPRGLIDRLANAIGYRDALVAKYGILMVAARRRLDKERPQSLISSLEERLSSQIKRVMEALKLPEACYWPWMTIFSYPSLEGGDCHPWIAQFRQNLGTAALEGARRARATINLYRSAALRWVSRVLGADAVAELKGLTGRLQRVHFWSEKDELEEQEDLELTNMVIDNFCPHLLEHRSLPEIRECRSVRSHIEPGRLRKAVLAIYILTDDLVGSGRGLRRIRRERPS